MTGFVTFVISIIELDTTTTNCSWPAIKLGWQQPIIRTCLNKIVTSVNTAILILRSFNNCANAKKSKLKNVHYTILFWFILLCNSAARYVVTLPCKSQWKLQMLHATVDSCLIMKMGSYSCVYLEGSCKQCKRLTHRPTFRLSWCPCPRHLSIILIHTPAERCSSVTLHRTVASVSITPHCGPPLPTRSQESYWQLHRDYWLHSIQGSFSLACSFHS